MAHVYDAREGKRIRKTFRSLATAKAWRADAQTQLRRGTMRAPTAMTLRVAAEGWLAGARDGSIRNRSGDRFKPSVIRGYDTSLRLRLLPALGGRKLSDVTRGELQRLVEGMLADNLDPSTIRNTIMPLRVIYRRALNAGDVLVNPTAGLELPAVRGTRDRVASPAEAEQLIEALAKRDRALWATAMYAGLRLGELLALKWESVDLATGYLRVERAFDPKERVFIEPKSRAGRRTVPIAAVLRDYLLEHKMSGGAEGLVFGRTPTEPFNASSTAQRAKRAWRRAGIEKAISIHECRHTFASLMIAAGVNLKALSTYMGHTSITITLDRYGHLLPGNEEVAAGLLDAYLDDARAAVTA